MKNRPHHSKLTCCFLKIWSFLFFIFLAKYTRNNQKPLRATKLCSSFFITLRRRTTPSRCCSHPMHHSSSWQLCWRKTVPLSRGGRDDLEMSAVASHGRSDGVARSSVPSCSEETNKTLFSCRLSHPPPPEKKTWTSESRRDVPPTTGSACFFPPPHFNFKNECESHIVSCFSPPALRRPASTYFSARSPAVALLRAPSLFALARERRLWCRRTLCHGLL